MNIQYWFSLFAVSQGAMVLGLAIFVFIYYLPKKRTEIKSNLRWNLVFLACSYIMLTFATAKTAAMQYYEWGNIWYWAVTIAYVAGDVSLIFAFRETVKNHRIKHIQKESEKDINN